MRNSGRGTLVEHSQLVTLKLSIAKVQSDCAALRSVLGEKKFTAFASAYLAKYPSRSYTMRNLCARVPHWPDSPLRAALPTIPELDSDS